MENVQNVQKEFFSPRELAGIVGVSESSIKRWVDSGRIPTTLTAGGHRRIPLAAALRFLRRERIAPRHPARLGVMRLDPAEGSADSDRDVGDRLFDALRVGRDDLAIGWIHSLYLAGRGVDRIVDGPFREALDRLGRLWHAGPEGIYLEHRATQICVRALNRLRALQSPTDDAKRTALGGAYAGDPYLLPTLAVATVLEAFGVRSTDLGPDTPIDALCAAVRQQRPDIVWLSVTAPVDGKAFRRDVARLLGCVDSSGGRLVLGGRQAERFETSLDGRIVRGRSMAELAAFVRGLGSAS